jgi:hypothetical protein
VIARQIALWRECKNKINDRLSLSTINIPTSVSANPPYELLLRLTHPAARCELLRLRNRRLALRRATKQPAGQINKSLSSPSRKNKSLSLSGKSVI